MNWQLNWCSHVHMYMCFLKLVTFSGFCLLPLKDKYMTKPHNFSSIFHWICPVRVWKWLRQSVSAAGPAPEGIRLKRLMEVISKCCREGCGVKVSRQSGSVHSAHSVQSALYCKSLLINLMPLAELHSLLKSATKTNSNNTKLVSDAVLEQLALLCIGLSELSDKVVSLHSFNFIEGGFMLTTLQHYIMHCHTKLILLPSDTKCFPKRKKELKWAFAKHRSWSLLCTHAYLFSHSAQALGQGLQSDSCRSLLIQADSLLEISDPFNNCPLSLSVIATITVIQGLLVKLQVYWLMSGSLCAIWDQTK